MKLFFLITSPIWVLLGGAVLIMVIGKYIENRNTVDTPERETLATIAENKPKQVQISTKSLIRKIHSISKGESGYVDKYIIDIDENGFIWLNTDNWSRPLPTKEFRFKVIHHEDGWEFNAPKEETDFVVQIALPLNRFKGRYYEPVIKTNINFPNRQ